MGEKNKYSLFIKLLRFLRLFDIQHCGVNSSFMWEQKNTSCWWIRRNEGKRGIKDDCFFGLSKYSVIYWGVEAWTRGGKVWGEMKSFSLDCKWATGFLSLSSGLNL